MAKKAYVYDGTNWVDIAQSTTDLTNYYTKSQSDAITPPGAWQSYTPTMAGGFSLSTGSWDAKYIQIGKTVHVRVKFTLGTSSAGTDLRFSAPVTASTSALAWNCYSTVAGTQYALIARLESTTNFRIIAQNAASTYTTVTQLTASVPGAWVAGDVIQFQATYEAA